jgi:hypothetical protein
MPALRFSPSGGGGSAVSENDEHALNPTHTQSIIVLCIVRPKYVSLTRSSLIRIKQLSHPPDAGAINKFSL